jgi:hypothetical protein
MIVPDSAISAAIDELKQQLTRAGGYLKRLDATSPSATPAGFRSSWPEYADEWAAYGAIPEQPRPIPLNHRQRAHLDQIDAWIATYTTEAKYRRALWLYALGVRPSRAARRLQCHRNTYALWVHEGCLDILAGLVSSRNDGPCAQGDFVT